jgi:hypothetical protein
MAVMGENRGWFNNTVNDSENNINIANKIYSKTCILYATKTWQRNTLFGLNVKPYVLANPTKHITEELTASLFSSMVVLHGYT